MRKKGSRANIRSDYKPVVEMIPRKEGAEAGKDGKVDLEKYMGDKDGNWGDSQMDTPKKP
jgi:hypothetical protein